MPATSSNSFQEYGWFSVQVDQYYAAIRIFARHYNALKLTYSELPQGQDFPSDLTCLSDSEKSFFMLASHSLNYMGTTKIFSDALFPNLSELPRDIINFGFYTCYCFQWTLFENFVKQSVMSLASDGLLSDPVLSRLQRIEQSQSTKAFLGYINSGNVFGHTPFVTVLPVGGVDTSMRDL